MARVTTPTLKPPSEKHEQAAIVKLLEHLGARVYVLGTRRPAGDHQGTRQTPGIADVLAFIPRHGELGESGRLAVWIEVKRRGGRVSQAQNEFHAQCLLSQTPVIVGTCDDVIAWLKLGGWVK